MQQGDKDILESIKLFVSRLDEKLPDGRVLGDAVNPQVKADAIAFVVEFPPLAEKGQRETQAEIVVQQAEAVQEETRLLSAELAAATLLAAVRHPELKDLIEPRQGTNAEEHVTNMESMRSRLDSNKEYLKKNNIELKLDPRHATAAIIAQAVKHRGAYEAKQTANRAIGGDSARLIKKRAFGVKLQTRINKQLMAAIEDDRGTQVKWGFTEREQARKPPTEKTAEVLAEGAPATPVTKPPEA